MEEMNKNSSQEYFKFQELDLRKNKVSTFLERSFKFEIIVILYILLYWNKSDINDCLSVSRCYSISFSFIINKVHFWCEVRTDKNDRNAFLMTINFFHNFNSCFFSINSSKRIFHCCLEKHFNLIFYFAFE